jgi:hypothetical protein
MGSSHFKTREQVSAPKIFGSIKTKRENQQRQFRGGEDFASLKRKLDLTFPVGGLKPVSLKAA